MDVGGFFGGAVEAGWVFLGWTLPTDTYVRVALRSGSLLFDGGDVRSCVRLKADLFFLLEVLWKEYRVSLLRDDNRSDTGTERLRLILIIFIVHSSFFYFDVHSSRLLFSPS